ncbi:MAG: hypothetical protein ACR2NB_10360 [Solirubrobacteraceae bacterium]
MSQPAFSERRPSSRQLLAAVVHDAATATPGVVELDGRWATQLPDGPLPGVVVAADGAGRHAVDLYVVAALVTLHDLSARLREATARAASASGLADALGVVAVHITDVAEAA